MTWNNIETCYFKLSDFDNSKPFIGFDYDNTLSTKFTTNLLPNVENVLLNLGNKYNICIFTNQMGISKGKTSHKQVQQIMNDFENTILNLSYTNGIPLNIQIFYSTEDDMYRKPMIGMFELMKKLLKPHKYEYYCGDAAGRIDDFSISDLYFANNCGIPFKTPEEVFQNLEPSKKLASKVLKSLQLYSKDNWINGILNNPRKIVDIEDTKNLDKKIKISKKYKNLLILVGPQGSGKSTISNYLSNKYNLGIINGDNQKTKSKMKKSFKIYESDKECKGIIIDNTCSTIKSRKEWINLLENIEKWEIKFIYINIDKLISIHLTKYRQCFGGNKIPSVAIHTFYKKLDIPTEKEGGEVITLTNAFSNQEFNQNLRFI